MKRDLKKLTTKELHILLDYPKSTKLLGNDKIAEIINELRKRENES